MTVIGKILVVDDNPGTRYATGRILRAAGYDIVEARSGQEALDAGDASIDLVVLDIGLPDFDGFEVCRRLRERDATLRTPVLHLSATYTSDIHRAEGLSVGANLYLTHPVEPMVLLGAVGALLRTQRAEDETRRSEAKFRAIFSAAPTGIALLSQEGHYAEVNPAMCRLLDRPREEILGQPGIAFVSEQHRGEVTRILRELAGGVQWRGTFPMMRSDGSQIDLDWNMTLEPSSGVLLAIATDITRQKQIEAERETLLISESKARAEAERANHLKDEFLATLGHELRNPLAAISSGASLLQSSPSLERRAWVEQMISRQVQQLQRLVDDLLDVARITRGKIELRTERLEVVSLLHSAAESVKGLIDQRSQRLTVSAPAEVLYLQADPIRFEQIIVNLVTNAIKFMPDGGQIYLSCGRENSEVVIRCRDEGVGMSPEALEMVFDPFVQVNPGVAGSGLGLGLTLVKKLAELHGGSIAASSQGPGKGSEFTLRLPAALPASQEPVDGLSWKADATTGSSSRLRIMLVDDNSDLANSSAMFLRTAGHQVTVAYDGESALEMAQRDKPDVVLLDLGLPGMSGYVVAENMRAADVLKNTPIIAISGYKPRTDEKSQKAGFDAHLVKPVAPDQLLDLMERLRQRLPEERYVGPS